MGEAKHRRSNPGAYKETHHLIEERIPPDSIILLRTELAKPENRDIYHAAIKGQNFEACMAIIAGKLDIILDGEYAVPDLADLLYRVMRDRGKHGNTPHNIDPRLVNAELVEREGSVSIEEVDGTGPGTVAPVPSGLRSDKDTRYRYTVCDGCTSSFDCIAGRECKLGTPAPQISVREVTKTKFPVN